MVELLHVHLPPVHCAVPLPLRIASVPEPSPRLCTLLPCTLPPVPVSAPNPCGLSFYALPLSLCPASVHIPLLPAPCPLSPGPCSCSCAYPLQVYSPHLALCTLRPPLRPPPSVLMRPSGLHVKLLAPLTLIPQPFALSMRR